MTKKKIFKKSQVSKPRNRLFLVVADDSKELHQALYYAARRAATAGGEVALFRCIEPIEGQRWGGVTESMEEIIESLAVERKLDNDTELILFLVSKTNSPFCVIELNFPSKVFFLNLILIIFSKSLNFFKKLLFIVNNEEFLSS